MTTYAEWLIEQSRDRIKASLHLMRLSRLLGRAQRRYPLSARTRRLQRALAHHYAVITEMDRAA